MPLIKWSDKYSINVPVFDEQHRRLVEMINQLFDATTSGHSKEALLSLREAFMRYASTHLEQEEAAQRATRYPGYAQHKAEHDRYVIRVGELMRDAPDAATAHDLMRFLKEWWVWHIQRTDKAFGSYLSKRAVQV